MKIKEIKQQARVSEKQPSPYYAFVKITEYDKEEKSYLLTPEDHRRIQTMIQQLDDAIYHPLSTRVDNIVKTYPEHISPCVYKEGENIIIELNTRGLTNDERNDLVTWIEYHCRGQFQTLRLRDFRADEEGPCWADAFKRTDRGIHLCLTKDITIIEKESDDILSPSVFRELFGHIRTLVMRNERAVLLAVDDTHLSQFTLLRRWLSVLAMRRGIVLKMVKLIEIGTCDAMALNDYLIEDNDGRLTFDINGGK